MISKTIPRLRAQAALAVLLIAFAILVPRISSAQANATPVCPSEVKTGSERRVYKCGDRRSKWTEVDNEAGDNKITYINLCKKLCGDQSKTPGAHCTKPGVEGCTGKDTFINQSKKEEKFSPINQLPKPNATLKPEEPKPKPADPAQGEGGKNTQGKLKLLNLIPDPDFKIDESGQWLNPEAARNKLQDLLSPKPLSETPAPEGLTGGTPEGVKPTIRVKTVAPSPEMLKNVPTGSGRFERLSPDQWRANNERVRELQRSNFTPDYTFRPG